MKILVVCQYYYPENFQVTPICEQLAKDGHDVTVLTGLPNYPTGIIPPEYKKGRRNEDVNGVKIIRCHEVPRKKGIVGLALNYMSYCLSASLKIRQLSDDYDIVFVYQLSPVTMGIPALLYSKKYKKKLVLYCCDLWPESLKMHIKSEKNPIFRLFKQISKVVYKSCDCILTQSKSFIKYLNEMFQIQQDKLKYLPAFSDDMYLIDDFSPDNETIDLVFLGNLGIAQNLIDVLRSVELIRDVPNFKIHFIGDGSVKDEMERYVKEHDLGDIVIFYGRRPVEEMPKYYKLADACIVSLNANNQTGLTLPAKVQGYMAAGKPILGMISGSAQEVILESNCGMCVDAGDVEGFAALLKEFILNNDQYKQCGQNGRDYFIRNYRKDIFMERLEQVIHEVRERS